MNKTSFCLLALFIIVIQTSFINAQIWFDIGVNGSVGTSVWSDFKIYEDGKIDITPKIASNLSLKLAVNFNETEALVLDIGYLNRTFQLQQKDLESSNISTQYMN